MFLTDSLSLAESPSANVIGIWPIIGYILSAVVCIVLGSFLNPIIEPVANKAFSKINAILFRRNKKIAGSWTHDWHVTSSRFPQVNTAHSVKLKQFNKNVSAKYTVKDNAGKVYTYAMEGKIDGNNYVSGEWYDVFAGNTYHGTFLLFIDVNMDSMEGIWIGKSQDNKVKSGKWEWKRESEN